MDILLYGGTFNPPHLGHTAAAKTAFEILRPDMLIWMPSVVPPHKALPPGSPDALHRLEMTHLAAETGVVSDLEITGGTRYTYDTVEALKKLYPGAEITVLMGGDMLKTLHTWHRSAELFAVCRAAALTRDGTKPVSGEFNALLLPHTPLEISSTRLRDMLPRGEGREYLPRAVWEYIRQNKLYGVP